MDQAEEIIKWFNDHTRALAMLQIEQAHRYHGRVWSLLYPVATRWSSRYIACARLVDIQGALQCLVIDKIETLVQLTSRGRNHQDTLEKQEKTRSLLRNVLNPEFWHKLRW